MGGIKSIELLENGTNIEVTEENKMNYIKLVANYIMVE